MIEKYGADTVRLYILYKAPPSEVLEWDDQSIIGMKRWLNRIENLVKQPTTTNSHEEIKVQQKLQQFKGETIKNVFF